MFVISRMEEYLERKSPYDYEDYIRILYNFKISTNKRKLNAFKYLVKKVLYVWIYKKCNKVVGTESSLYKRVEPQEYYNFLMQYDIISFDVFDTLILRAVQNSTDLYYLIGMKLHYIGFKEIREQAEIEARHRLGLDDTDDVTLYDIYFIINEWCGIDIEKGVKAELEVEDSMSFANPYWIEVIKELVEAGKKVIATTDMYISELNIRKLLQSRGYQGIQEIFVSCDIDASKRNGKIFDVIEEHFGVGNKYLHIGDNRFTDFQMPKYKGWDVIFYRNVHDLGKKFRTVSKSIISDSITGGIIDVFLHNGKNLYEPLEEFGFNYYGKLHIGYCQWLEKLAREKNIDKFLFVSRDGYLLKKIYNNYFNTISSEYVYVSRLALSQIISMEDMDMFLQQNFEPKVNRGNITIVRCLEELGLQILVEILKEQGIDVMEILNKENYSSIKHIIYKNRLIISSVFENARIAAKEYFTTILGNSKTICIVDVGWYGTCTRGIIGFVKKYMKWDGEIFGAQIGVECSKQNIELYAQGVINAYVFSPDYNRYIYKLHDFKIGNVLDEIVFSAPEPSLLNYGFDDNGNFKLIFTDEPNENVDIVSKIQRGVYEYVIKYCEIEEKLGMQLIISPDAAYQPVLDICRNRDYINKLFGKYYVHRFASASEIDGEFVCKI